MRRRPTTLAVIGAFLLAAGCAVADAQNVGGGARTTKVLWNLQGDAGQASWLPINNALDAGTETSQPIPFETTSGGPGGVWAYAAASTGSGALVVGTLCLLEGDSDIGFSNVPTINGVAACQTLDGGVGPYAWDTGPLHAGSFEFTYTPTAGSDGGFVYVTAHTTN